MSSVGALCSPIVETWCAFDTGHCVCVYMLQFPIGRYSSEVAAC